MSTYLRLGPEPLLLLPPLDALVTSLPIAKPFGAASTLADERWLFPGKWAGHHQHPTSLMGRLNKLGIATRASRNTAMLHLAAIVPPAVFASLIGISIGAALAGPSTPAATGPPTPPSARRRPPARVRTSSRVRFGHSEIAERYAGGMVGRCAPTAACACVARLATGCGAHGYEGAGWR